MIENIFNSFKGSEVIVIGDIMIDRYQFGKVERVSPEAPVPVLSLTHEESRLGGAGNVALNLKALGANVTLYSVCGVDKSGNELLRMVYKHKISSQVHYDKNRRTTVKTRYISNNNHLLRVDSEDTHLISESYKEVFINSIRERIKLSKVDVIIFEDYDKGVLHKELIEDVISLANDFHIPTLVDPKNKNFNFYKGATLFKPNLKELKDGIKSSSIELEVVTEKLLTDMSLKGCLITLSENGVYINLNGEKIRVDAHKREITDVSGAGDTVSAVAALCLAQGLEPRLIAELSNLAGGLVCQHSGVVPINVSDFYNEALKIKVIN